MRVTRINLADPPKNLLTAIEQAEKAIKAGQKGMLTESQMQEAVGLSEFFPADTLRPRIVEYLDENQNPISTPRKYALVPEREKARMSACGDKLFLGFTRTGFSSGTAGEKVARCATLAYLWMPNATFHAHGNEIGDVNRGWTTEDYEVAGGGPAWYVMGPDVFYVEPDADPDSGIVGWEIPPGKLHGVFSEDPNNPALAVLRFHHQGLAIRADAKHPQGWGFPRDEKVYTFASRAIRSMTEIAQSRNADPNDHLPQRFIEDVRKTYEDGVQI